MEIAEDSIRRDSATQISGRGRSENELPRPALRDGRYSARCSRLESGQRCAPRHAQFPVGLFSPNKVRTSAGPAWMPGTMRRLRKVRAGGPGKNEWPSTKTIRTTGSPVAATASSNCSGVREDKMGARSRFSIISGPFSPSAENGYIGISCGVNSGFDLPSVAVEKFPRLCVADARLAKFLIKRRAKRDDISRPLRPPQEPIIAAIIGERAIKTTDLMSGASGNSGGGSQEIF